MAIDFRGSRIPKPGETLEVFKTLLELNYFNAALRLWEDAFSVVQMMAAFRMADAPLPDLSDWPEADELRQMFRYAVPALHAMWIRDEIAANAVRAVTAGGDAIPDELTSGWRELLMGLWDDNDGKILAAAIERAKYREKPQAN